MPNPTYEIRIMFEWGGGSLWGMNAAAKAKYGYSEIEKSLPISLETKSLLGNLSDLHDTAMNWSDPSSPSPWTIDDHKLFETKAHLVLEDLRTELGSDFHVYYTPLGEP